MTEVTSTPAKVDSPKKAVRRRLFKFGFGKCRICKAPFPRKSKRKSTLCGKKSCKRTAVNEYMRKYQKGHKRGKKTSRVAPGTLRIKASDSSKAIQRLLKNQQESLQLVRTLFKNVAKPRKFQIVIG
ncbi:MAG TPA: hypothetical protein VJ044_20655 [Candidatus Hodarchaeales archaeon]|nr:hypothetical protein [Candidatus Hodarchaeales archaeon]